MEETTLGFVSISLRGASLAGACRDPDIFSFAFASAVSFALASATGSRFPDVSNWPGFEYDES
jgi:hypothetical protein